MSKNLDSEYKMFAYVREFLTSYIPEAKNYSDSTVALYRIALTAFFDYIADIKGIGYKKMDFDVFSEQNVKDFMLHHKNEHGCSPSTCNTYLTALRSFTHYCVMRDSSLYSIECELKRIPRMKEPTNLTVKHFSKNALKAIMEVPDRRTRIGRRNYLLMFLLYDTGCRISEICTLRIGDVRSRGNNFFISINVKGNKHREVPICKQSVHLIEDYAHEIGCHDNERQYLFFGRDCYSCLTTNACQRMIREAGAKARKKCTDVPDELTPHMFRHSRAMHLYEDGVPLATIKQFLGHSSIDTTYIYAYASVEMKRNAIDKATDENALLNKMKIKQRATSPLRNKDEFKKYFGLKDDKY